MIQYICDRCGKMIGSVRKTSYEIKNNNNNQSWHFCSNECLGLWIDCGSLMSGVYELTVKE